MMYCLLFRPLTITYSAFGHTCVCLYPCYAIVLCVQIRNETFTLNIVMWIWAGIFSTRMSFGSYGRQFFLSLPLSELAIKRILYWTQYFFALDKTIEKNCFCGRYFYWVFKFRNTKCSCKFQLIPKYVKKQEKSKKSRRAGAKSFSANKFYPEESRKNCWKLEVIFFVSHVMKTVDK